jgi:hypothetical protein
MPLIDQIREEKLIELAKKRFDPDLWDAENKVLHDSASSEDLPEPDEKAPRPEVRADFLRWLATDPEAALNIDPKGLRVYAATIPGKLDLEKCHVNPALTFFRCDFQGEINLRFAETQGLFFFGSSLAVGIRADWVIVHGPLFFQRIESKGEIRLLGARIMGQLACNGAKLRAAVNALIADGAKISNGVFLTDGFESEGTIRLHGAEITGPLVCNGAKLKPTGNALQADGAKIDGGVLLRDTFECSGTIRLLGAEIKGNLECDGAKLTGTGNALFMDGVQIGGDIFLRAGFECSGEIRLLGARVVGVFDCSSARLTAEGYTLSLDGIQIGGGVFLRDGFGCSGAIRLHGAQIEGTLDCSSAKLTAKGNALSLDGAQVGSSVFLRDGFRCSGAIRLSGARIGGDLTVRGAKVAGVLCQNMVVSNDLIWQNVEKSKETKLYLIGAKVKNLRDDRASWPEEGNLDLDGLVYEELTLHEPSSIEQIKAGTNSRELPLVAKDRIDWIMLQPEERRTEPQPWMQLAKHLETKGDHKDAKHVIYKFRCLRAHVQKKWWISRRWAIFFAWMEEAPLRIWRTIVFFLLLGWLIFGFAGVKGAIAPTEPEAYKAFTSKRPMPAAYPTLNPFVYTLENAVPLVKLGQDEKWAPDRRYPGTKWYTNYWFLMWSRWLLILFGWVQATVLAAALSGRFKP